MIRHREIEETHREAKNDGEKSIELIERAENHREVEMVDWQQLIGSDWIRT